MTAKKTPNVLCPACGKGRREYRARPGRTYEYKGFQYPIPARMKLVECGNCHEMPMTPAEVTAVEGPIAKLHRERMADLVDDALRRNPSTAA